VKRGLPLALALFASARPAGAADDLLDLYEAVEGAPAAAPAPAPAHDPRARALLEALAIVTVRIDGVRNARGSVRVLAFDDADAWHTLAPAGAVGFGTAAAHEGSVDVTLRAHGTGPYALFAFHDENDDETLDRPGGRPREGYAFSGAIEPFLPPPFARAAEVGVEGRVRLHYPPDPRRR